VPVQVIRGAFPALYSNYAHKGTGHIDFRATLVFQRPSVGIFAVVARNENYIAEPPDAQTSQCDELYYC
jgi:hypothetical protein